MNLPELFDQSLLDRPNDVGLEWQGREYSFGELDQRANRVARFLLARGIRKGDRVALYLANRIEIVDVYLACVRIGAIFLPINILYRESEIRHILNDAEPALVVAERPIDDAVPHCSIDEVEADRLPPSNRPACDAAPDEPALIVYTSGTTGSAKGVVLSHENLVANASNLIGAWGITAEDRLLLALPLFHVHGLGNGLHTWLASGLRLRLLERFTKETIGDELLDFRPTLFFGVPTMYVRLLDLNRVIARRIGASARLFVSGSAPLSPETSVRFREKFDHVILERYGMTETLMTLSNPLDGDRRPGTVGLPLPGVEARIVDADRRIVEQGVGELEVRGANVFAAYWRRPEATASSFRDGWFSTGDLAERSADGYYTLHGRKNELIISGGFKIFPREVEEIVGACEGVREVAIVGVPDEVRGQVPVGFIVAEGDVDLEEIESVCRDRLASFKVPSTWIRVPALPRNALGKVRKNLLAESVVRPESWNPLDQRS